MIKFIKLTSCILLILFIFGCSSQKKAVSLDAKFQTAAGINPDIKQNPSPINVVIYQLKSASRFQNADFFSLYNNASKALGEDLLETTEAEIKPKAALKKNYALFPETKYIGIVAAYRDIDNANWRRLVELPKKKKVSIGVDLSVSDVYVHFIG